jgi:hypothetical protein
MKKLNFDVLVRILKPFTKQNLITLTLVNKQIRLVARYLLFINLHFHLVQPRKFNDVIKFMNFINSLKLNFTNENRLHTKPVRTLTLVPHVAAHVIIIHKSPNFSFLDH